MVDEERIRVKVWSRDAYVLNNHLRSDFASELNLNISAALTETVPGGDWTNVKTGNTAHVPQVVKRDKKDDASSYVLVLNRRRLRMARPVSSLLPQQSFSVQPTLKKTSHFDST